MYYVNAIGAIISLDSASEVTLWPILFILSGRGSAFASLAKRNDKDHLGYAIYESQ